MSELLKETNQILKKPTIEIDELLNYEKKLCNEYNIITQEYRELFKKIKIKIKKNREDTIKNCNHKYRRYSEYHNDHYFVCDICGHEKY